MKINKKIKKTLNVLAASMLVASSIPVPVALASHLTGNPATYTLDADFDDGSYVNVNHNSPNSNQLQLNGKAAPFGFIWIAASARGTIIKVDTQTGAVLGEYKSSPDGRYRNPSRTTVDANGNVWSGNRDEDSGGKGSVVEIGLKENGQCQDRDNDGIIETSTGLGDIKAWANGGGIDNNGGVSTAEDECIIKYVRTTSQQVRHVSVDSNNNIWVGGLTNNAFNLLDNSTGAVLASFNVNCGGYGGLVDKNGVVWSSSRSGSWGLLRYDTKNTIAAADDTWECLPSPSPYGMGIDGFGNIWNSLFEQNAINKYNPAGALYPGFPKNTGGANFDRGVTVTPDNNVWVANSGGSDVSRLDNDGNVLKVIPVGDGPMGMAVDSAGKVWAVNYNSNNASRIDPNAGSDGLGQVDLTVSLGSGANPYNYSDMTGSIAPALPTAGSWTIIHNSGIDNAKWGTATWNASTPGDSSIVVKVASSNDGVTFGPEEIAVNGADLSIADGKYIRATVTFTRSTSDANNDGIKDSPILYDIKFAAEVEPESPCVPIDIKPNTCPNIFSIARGEIFKVAVLGTANFDASQVDVKSVKLEGVSPLCTSYVRDVATPFVPYTGRTKALDCTKAGVDGYRDFIMNFGMVSFKPLLINYSQGSVAVLKLTGKLKNGTPICGEDVVVIDKTGCK